MIQEQASPFLNPVHCVWKAGGTSVGPILDLRNLNLKVISPRFRVEPIQKNLHRLSGCEYFSSFDCKEEYYGIPLHSDSYNCTVFIYEGRQDVWKFLPQGLKSSCASFQTLMHKLFDMSSRDVAVFLDDVLCFSKSLEDNLKQFVLFFEFFKKSKF